MSVPVLRPVKTAKDPLSLQAKQYLQDLIVRGSYQPGERLPAEEVFAAQLGISRPTLREALLHLQQEGVIVRKHGVGTFVAANAGRTLNSGLEVLESIERIASRAGIKVEMGSVQLEERDPTAVEMFNLGVSRPEPVLAAARTMLVDSRPAAYLLDVVPVELLTRADLDEAFTGSVLDLFIHKGTPVLSHSLTHLAAVAADAELAAQLQVRRETPLLCLEARLVSAGGKIVDFSLSYFVPGFFSFHIVRRIGAA